MDTTTAIILVGGRGTRLGSLTDNTPKPLLPVAGRPFLLHLLDYLNQQGITHVVLSTGFLASQFDSTLGDSYKDIRITYALEESPLGTGGAIQNAFSKIDDTKAFVLNGDTLFQVDLNHLESTHNEAKAEITIALRSVPDVSRYGHITLEGHRIIKMHEKGSTGPGLINGGTYLIEHATYKPDAFIDEHSFEKRTIPDAIVRSAAHGLVQDVYFIDIGIPSDLEKAGKDLA